MSSGVPKICNISTDNASTGFYVVLLDKNVIIEGHCDILESMLVFFWFDKDVITRVTM